MQQIDLNEDTYLLTCDYDFRTMGMEQFLSTFDTQYIWPREQVINNEDQFYVDPLVHPHYSPFELTASGLRITASPTPHALENYAMGVSDTGRALIQARKEAGMLQIVTDEIREKHFTYKPLVSGLITSRSFGHSQRYGYWEASLKLPNAAGAWPAFWLLPTHHSWPEGVAKLPEIDIMEAVWDVIQAKYHTAVHSNVDGEGGKMNSSTNTASTGMDLVNEYHRYGVSKEPDFIVFFFDGKEVHRVPTPDDHHDPVHILLNLATGGWGGDVDVGEYPAHFDIEWVRVYENAVPKQRKDKGDVVWILQDGTPVTKSILNVATRYLIEVGETFPIIPQD